jgi:hypothetical protein
MQLSATGFPGRLALPSSYLYRFDCQDYNQGVHENTIPYPGKEAGLSVIDTFCAGLNGERKTT